MANIAFALHAKGTPIAAMLARGVHLCVLANIEHDIERRAGGSTIELIGYDWRRAHGFGRKFSCGNSVFDERRRQKSRLDKRRQQKPARIRARLAGATVAKAFRRVFRLRQP